jgi:tRNA U34 5-carboxymethylaminomethyl modifying GTPase MnmE/TrmE
MKTLVAVDSRLERLAAIADEFEDRALAAEARAERQRLQQARFFVACVGQFKRGKSTLINALVGAPVLPVGVVPVTSVVTILSFADAPRATVRLTNGRSQGVALDSIADFIDERRNPDNRRGAAIVEVGLPSTLLRNGLCLVDTPGIGSIHATNTEATRAFLPRIDVALAIVGPDPPIAGAELSMLLDADREAGELALVLNKSDQVSASSLAEVTEFTCTAVASASGRAVEHFFAISALERLTTNAPTRDWSALESFLDRLSLTARDRLVERAADRSVARVAGRLVSQISQREEALQSPLDQIEQQAARLQQAVTDVDQAILEAQIRKRLATAVHAAERALALAREKRHMSEADVSVTLQRLDNLRDEVTALGG